MNSAGAALMRLRRGRRCTAFWSAMGSSIPKLSSTSGRSRGGSGPSRCTCGRWTSSAVFRWRTAGRASWSPVSMTTPGSSSSRRWSRSRPGGRSARRSPRRCVVTVCPRKCSRITERSSPVGTSSRSRWRCSSSGSAGRMGSSSGWPSLARRPRRARSSGCTRRYGKSSSTTSSRSSRRPRPRPRSTAGSRATTAGGRIRRWTWPLRPACSGPTARPAWMSTTTPPAAMIPSARCHPASDQRRHRRRPRCWWT